MRICFVCSIEQQVKETEDDEEADKMLAVQDGTRSDDIAKNEGKDSNGQVA